MGPPKERSMKSVRVLHITQSGLNHAPYSTTNSCTTVQLYSYTYGMRKESTVRAEFVFSTSIKGDL